MRYRKNNIFKIKILISSCIFFICLYYFLISRWSCFLPWTLVLLSLVLWQINISFIQWTTNLKYHNKSHKKITRY